MDIVINLGYEVSDEDAEKERIGFEILNEESDAFAQRVRDRLERQGLDIHRFSMERKSED